jgi:hypothetical protein
MKTQSVLVKMLAILVVMLIGATLGGAALAQEKAPATDLAATTQALQEDMAEIQKEAPGGLSPELLYDLLNKKIRAEYNREPEAVAVIVPVSFFLMTIGIIALALYFGNRKQRILHETLRAMVEKGREIPPEIFAAAAKPKRSDLRRGILLIATGLGIMICVLLAPAIPQVGNGPLYGLGVIPAVIGLGHLLAWKLEKKSE